MPQHNPPHSDLPVSGTDEHARMQHLDWPPHDEPLSVEERADIQALVAAHPGEQWSGVLADRHFRRYEATVLSLLSALRDTEQDLDTARRALDDVTVEAVRAEGERDALRDAVEDYIAAKSFDGPRVERDERIFNAWRVLRYVASRSPQSETRDETPL